MYYTSTKLYYDINCWAIGINIMGQWCHNSLSFKIEFQPLLTWTLEMLYAVHTLGACRLLCKVSQKSRREELQDTLKVLKNGYKLLRGLKTPTGRRHEPVGYLWALLRSWTVTGTGKQTQLVVTENCTQVVWTVSLKHRQLCYAASLNFSFRCYKCCKFYIFTFLLAVLPVARFLW